MIYLLDTDLLIFMLRGIKPGRRAGQRERATRLAERCRLVRSSGDSLGISAVTVSELEFGARNSGRYDTEIAAVRKILTPFDLYDYESHSCPVHYGRIRDELESGGTSIGSMDMLIAAHALALDATFVSNNQSHFSRISDLKTANWLL